MNLLMVGVVAVLALPQHEASWRQVAAVPIFGDGRLKSCALNFQAAQQTTFYGDGRTIGIDGSANIYHFGGGQMSLLIKSTIINGPSPGLQPTETAYLISGLKTNAADSVRTQPSETPGYTLTGFDIGQATTDAIAGIIRSRVLTVGVVPKNAATSITSRFDLDDETATTWSSCVSELIDQARDALAD